MTDNHSALRCPEHGGIGFVRDCVDPRHTSPVAPGGEPVAEALSALHEAFGLLASHRVARDSELGRKLDEVLYALESRPASPASAASDRELQRPETVERVARAILDADYGPKFALDALNERGREKYTRMAKAALAALEEK